MFKSFTIIIRNPEGTASNEDRDIFVKESKAILKELADGYRLHTEIKNTWYHFIYLYKDL